MSRPSLAFGCPLLIATPECLTQLSVPNSALRYAAAHLSVSALESPVTLVSVHTES